jgi:glycosyltransferase involved in cell wall biosynthesis
MLISVLLIVLNNEEFIGQAIDNYISNQNTDTELVIVDGASTDGTISIINNLIPKCLNYQFISEPDTGQSNAMNKAIKIAKGKFISFLNVDDFYSENTLNIVANYLKRNPSTSFLTGNCKVFDIDGKLIYINKPNRLKPWHILSGYHFPVNPTAYFYNKAIHDKVGLYNENNHYTMDLEFLLRAVKHYDFQYVNEDWGNFRLLINSKTGSDILSGVQLDKKQNLLNSYYSYFNYYIQFRTYLYLLKQKLSSNPFFFFILLKDKIKYEFSKLKK